MFIFISLFTHSSACDKWDHFSAGVKLVCTDVYILLAFKHCILRSFLPIRIICSCSSRTQVFRRWNEYCPGLQEEQEWVDLLGALDSGILAWIGSEQELNLNQPNNRIPINNKYYYVRRGYGTIFTAILNLATTDVFFPATPLFYTSIACCAFVPPWSLLRTCGCGAPLLHWPKWLLSVRNFDIWHWIRVSLLLTLSL